MLGELLSAGADLEGFWPQVDENLAEGRIRLLFVADVIPIELRRIVEFLNKQMRPAQVLAIELRQFEGQGLRTIVPTVLGRMETNASKISTLSSPRIWTEQNLFEKLDGQQTNNERQSARLVVDAI